MINILDVATIRQMFPDDELYFVKIIDQEYVIKTITSEDYATIKEITTTPYDEVDLITKTAIIYPSNYDVYGGEAGIPKIISDLVLKFSLLHQESRADLIDRIEYYNNELETNIEAQMPVIIKMAFPEFTFEEIDSWNMDKRLKNLARAIYGLKLRGITTVEGFTFDEVPEEVSFEDKAEYITKCGGDPMVELYDEYKTKPNMVELPFITNKQWDDEDTYNAIQRQLQKPKKNDQQVRGSIKR